MTARNGLLDLIERVRIMSDAGTAEHTIQGQSYYTDNHIIERLDRHRTDIYRQPLLMQAEYDGPNEVYKKYYFPTPNVERAESGSAAWVVSDYSGSAIGTANYTAYYDAQYIEFPANTLGSAYYLTYREYDVERTVAAVWEEKAAFVSSRPTEISTDNHTIKRGDLRKLYLDNASFYRGRAKPKAVKWVRDDIY